MLNWQTNKLHILFYPPGAGGNFLNSCLALSKDACPQNHLLLNLTQNKKIKKIFDSVKHFDFSQGVVNQFGVFLYNIPNYKLLKLQYPKSLVAKSFDQRLWFINAHSETEVEKCLGLFPNAKIIEFKNYEKFLKFRKWPHKSCNDYYEKFNSIKGDEWIDDNFDNLPLVQRNEIIECFPSFEYYSKNSNILKGTYKIDYEFDTSSFLDFKFFIVEVKNMYNNLNIDDFNHTLIKKLYELWINK